MTDYNFKPFSEVLVRENTTEEWICGIYSHYDDVLKSHCVMGVYYEHCIPYKGNEALLGTTDEPKPKRWRAKDGESYWAVFAATGFVHCPTECGSEADDQLYSIGNYFHTKEEAEEMGQKIRQLFK